MRLLSGLLLLLLLSGCELYGKIGTDDANIEGALPVLLRGEWVFTQAGSTTPGERYSIDDSTIQFGNDSGTSPTSFKGDIRFVSNFSAAAGVIIIEYAEAPTYPLYNGKQFFAVYYRDLKTDTVQLANAINLSDFSAPDTETLEEAVKKFTRLSIGAFINWGIVQHQSKVRQ